MHWAFTRGNLSVWKLSLLTLVRLIIHEKSHSPSIRKWHIVLHWITVLSCHKYKYNKTMTIIPGYSLFNSNSFYPLKIKYVLMWAVFIYHRVNGTWSFIHTHMEVHTKIWQIPSPTGNDTSLPIEHLNKCIILPNDIKHSECTIMLRGNTPRL